MNYSLPANLLSVFFVLPWWRTYSGRYKIQKACESVDQGDKEGFLDNITDDICAEIEEKLMRIGFTLKLDNPIKLLETSHLVDTRVKNANTLVLPLKADDWTLNLELTVLT